VGSSTRAEARKWEQPPRLTGRSQPNKAVEPAFGFLLANCVLKEAYRE
jgi:hypothetical protein